jgi:hypothetical protein
MLHKSTIQLLRFHFSIFPHARVLVCTNATGKHQLVQSYTAIFIILHLLVYPASNGYNSYMDRDETPIGGLKNPSTTHQAIILHHSCNGCRSRDSFILHQHWYFALQALPSTSWHQERTVTEKSG